MPDAYKPPAPVEPVLAPIPQYVGGSESASPATTIPQKNLYGHDLRKLKSYKILRRNKKIGLQHEIFMQDLAGVLSQFSVAEHLYDDELLATFLSIQESYFIMGSKQERAEAKKLSLSLMLPYFKDDALLLEKTVKHVWPRVIKSSALRRVLSRLKLFFFREVLPLF